MLRFGLVLHIWQHGEKKKTHKADGFMSFLSAGAVGIEPTSMVLETTVLPLNYAPIQLCRKPTKGIVTQYLALCNSKVENFLSEFS